jgi:hypothetical protein
MQERNGDNREPGAKDSCPKIKVNFCLKDIGFSLMYLHEKSDSKLKSLTAYRCSPGPEPVIFFQYQSQT